MLIYCLVDQHNYHFAYFRERQASTMIHFNKLSVLNLALVMTLVCCQNHESTPQATSSERQADLNDYEIDYQLLPNQKYLLSSTITNTMMTEPEGMDKYKWNPVNWKKDETLSTSQIDQFSLSTTTRDDTLRLTLTHDSSTVQLSNSPLQKQTIRPRHKTSTGFSADGKVLSLPSRPYTAVWKDQENLPRGKIRIGETYTYYQPYYNDQKPADTLVYTMVEVKDSIAYFQATPREHVMNDGKTKTTVTRELEYDLRKNVYRRTVINSDRLTFFGADKVFHLTEVKEYLIGVEKRF